MSPLAIIYFAYMFISFYFLLLTILLYVHNRKNLFDYPASKKNYSVSVIIPAYNEEKTIAATIQHVAQLDYDNLQEIIVVNDGSKDNTLNVLKKLASKYRLLKIINKSNSGKADSINQALKQVKGELVAIVDADSYPDKTSLSKMVGYFDDPKVGAVSPQCTPRNRSTFLEKMQLIEYKVIALTRKILEYIDSIYVVTGTLGLYRKKALDDIGGFDTRNITEDIEATWHLVHNGWKIRMCLDAQITTEVPNKLKPWYIQRRRWGLGGLQCINKYKSVIFRKGMLGAFIVPFFTLGLFLGLIGMSIFVYLFMRRLISAFLTAQYNIQANVPIITLQEMHITPSVLNYFGIVLFLLFFFFTLFALSVMKDRFFEKQRFFNLLFYITLYLMVYPIVLITSTWHYLRGKNIWR